MTGGSVRGSYPRSSDAGRPRDEEPQLQACLGLLYHLLTAEGNPDDRDAESQGRWELKRSLLLSDYQRRSADLDQRVKAFLDARVIDSFAAPRRAEAWHDLGDAPQVAKPVDIAILTILPEEMHAALDAFRANPRPERRDRGQAFHRAKVECRQRPGTPLTIIISSAAKPLNVHVARPITQLRNQYMPRAVFLVGIAAGLHDEVNVGDVVVPDHVFYYEAEKLTEHGHNPRPQHAEPDDPFRYGFDAYEPRTTGLAEETHAFMARMPTFRRPPSLSEDHVPRIVSHNATIAAGERVLRDGNFLAQLRERFDNTICAADQESYGFAEAVRDLPWLIFRGISDHADPVKRDEWKYAAAGCAAVCLRNFLENGYYPPDLQDF